MRMEEPQGVAVLAKTCPLGLSEVGLGVRPIRRVPVRLVCGEIQVVGTRGQLFGRDPLGRVSAS